MTLELFRVFYFYFYSIVINEPFYLRTDLEEDHRLLGITREMRSVSFQGGWGDTI